MKRTLLHIGTNKTGTSSLQYWLDSNGPLIQSSGYIYPEIGKTAHAHHELSRMIKRSRGNKLALARLRDKVERAREAFGHAIFSSENFHTILTTDSVASVFDPETTQVIVYLREHVSYLVSWYQQAVQSRNISMTLKEFAELHFTSLDALVGRWVSVYGEGSVIVKVFNREELLGRDIVTDFVSTFLGGSIAQQAAKAPEKNVSVTGNLLFLKRMMNLFLDKETASGLANEVGALSSLSPSFAGKLHVERETLAFLKRLTAEDRSKLLARDIRLPSPPDEVTGEESPQLRSLNDDLNLILSALARKRASPCMEVLAKVLPMLEVKNMPAMGGKNH